MKNQEFIAIVEAALSEDSFMILNRKLIQKLGLTKAVFLTDMIGKYRYFRKEEKLKNGWFFNSEEQRKHDTGITKHSQRRCIEELVELDILKVKRVGVPARQWFSLSHKSIYYLLSGYRGLEVGIQTTIKSIKGKNNNKRTFSKEKGDNSGELPLVTKDEFILERKRVLKKKESTVAPKLLFNSWNSLSPLLTKHKDNPKSNTYKNCIRLLNLLLDGKYGSACKIKPETIKQLKIPKELLSGKWTRDMILRSFENFKLALQEEYDTDKNKQPKTLKDFIYSFNNYPHIIKFYLYPPKLRKEPLFVPDKYVSNWIKDGITSDAKKSSDLLRERLGEVWAYSEALKIPSNVDPSWWESFMIPILENSKRGLIWYYAEYLSDANFDWRTSMIGPKKEHWDKFLYYFGERIGLDMGREKSNIFEREILE